MELVTGFAGTAHVDPVDSAHLNAAAFGPDAYLLDTQNKLEASLETANKLVIDTGDLMIQGHHFTVVESEEVALQSGVSGQKRNALVCARYEKAEGTGVESASWIVKYGTATTGTPADPSVITGNILDGVDSVHEEPIFRIEYDGITPGNPILLVPEFQSASEFRDSISPVSVECDLNANAQGQKIKLSKVGKLVTMSIGGTQLKSNLVAWGSRQIATIPLGFRPKDEKIYAALCTDNGVAAIKVANGGGLSVEARKDALAAKLDFFANASWVTD